MRQAENLAGRRFDVVIPFGCGGPATAESKASMRWRYDAVDLPGININISGVADAQAPTRGRQLDLVVVADGTRALRVRLVPQRPVRLAALHVEDIWTPDKNAEEVIAWLKSPR